MQKHGMVLNIEGSSAVVLTRGGEFCRIPSSPGMEIGQDVTWAAGSEIGPRAPKQQHRRSGKRARSPYRTMTAGIAASIALVAGLWYGIGGHVDQAQAYAFVSVDVNPDVSLTVNRDLKVISASSENAEGQKIIASLNLKGQSLAVAMQEIIATAVSDHRLTPHGSIMVASAPAQTGSVDMSQVESEATQDVHQAIADNADIAALTPAVVSVGVSDSLWKASEQVHVSPARLAAYLIARSGGYQGTMTGLSGDILERFANTNAVASTSQALQSATPSQVATLLSDLGGGLNDSASSAGDGSGDSGQGSDSGGESQSGADGGGLTQPGGMMQGDASGNGSEPGDTSHGDRSGRHDGHSDKNSHDGSGQSSDNRGQQDGMGTQSDGQSGSGDAGAGGSSDVTSNTAAGDGQNQTSASISNQDGSSSGTDSGGSVGQSSGSDTTSGGDGAMMNSTSGSGGDSWSVNATGGSDSSSSSNNGD